MMHAKRRRGVFGRCAFMVSRSAGNGRGRLSWRSGKCATAAIVSGRALLLALVFFCDAVRRQSNV